MTRLGENKKNVLRGQGSFDRFRLISRGGSELESRWSTRGSRVSGRDKQDNKNLFCISADSSSICDHQMRNSWMIKFIYFVQHLPCRSRFGLGPIWSCNNILHLKSAKCIPNMTVFTAHSKAKLTTYLDSHSVTQHGPHVQSWIVSVWTNITVIIHSLMRMGPVP